MSLADAELYADDTSREARGEPPAEGAWRDRRKVLLEQAAAERASRREAVLRRLRNRDRTAVELNHLLQWEGGAVGIGAVLRDMRERGEAHEVGDGVWRAGPDPAPRPAAAPAAVDPAALRARILGLAGDGRWWMRRELAAGLTGATLADGIRTIDELVRLGELQQEPGGGRVRLPRGRADGAAAPRDTTTRSAPVVRAGAGRQEGAPESAVVGSSPDPGEPAGPRPGSVQTASPPAGDGHDQEVSGFAPDRSDTATDGEPAAQPDRSESPAPAPHSTVDPSVAAAHRPGQDGDPTVGRARSGETSEDPSVRSSPADGVATGAGVETAGAPSDEEDEDHAVVDAEDPVGVATGGGAEVPVTPSGDRVAYGRRVRADREARGLTQGQLARLVAPILGRPRWQGVQGQISDLELGRSTPDSVCRAVEAALASAPIPAADAPPRAWRSHRTDDGPLGDPLSLRARLHALVSAEPGITIRDAARRLQCVSSSISVLYAPSTRAREPHRWYPHRVVGADHRARLYVDEPSAPAELRQEAGDPTAGGDAPDGPGLPAAGSAAPELGGRRLVPSGDLTVCLLASDGEPGSPAPAPAEPSPDPAHVPAGGVLVHTQAPPEPGASTEPSDPSPAPRISPETTAPGPAVTPASAAGERVGLGPETPSLADVADDYARRYCEAVDRVAELEREVRDMVARAAIAERELAVFDAWLDRLKVPTSPPGEGRGWRRGWLEARHG